MHSFRPGLVVLLHSREEELEVLCLGVEEDVTGTNVSVEDVMLNQEVVRVDHLRQKLNKHSVVETVGGLLLHLPQSELGEEEKELESKDFGAEEVLLSLKRVVQEGLQIGMVEGQDFVAVLNDSLGFPLITGLELGAANFLVISLVDEYFPEQRVCFFSEKFELGSEGSALV